MTTPNSEASREVGSRLWIQQGALVLLVALAGVLTSCESFDLFGSGDDGPPEYREVVAEKAPFYNQSPRDSSIPFIYLTRGTEVEWLKDGEGHTRVRLANGSTGWVPSASLGTSNAALPGVSSVDEERAAELRREESSAAIRHGRQDNSLDYFNVP